MSKQKPITKTQQNLENRLSADEIQQALGAEYQVRVCGEQYVLETARGFEIASFRPNKGVIDVIFRIEYKPNQPLKDADDIGGDSLKAIKDRAEHEFKASHWKAWESRGFILQEIVTDWDDACNEYRFNFQLMRPVASVADITEIIRWVDDQPQDEWIR
jgi:hypothetical protein